MQQTKLIERWLPISALNEESVRERRAASSLPPTNYLHVWWARRPLIASRAAILASMLPSTVKNEDFLRMLGIQGDPVAARRKIEAAKKSGLKLEGNPYGYPRAFEFHPPKDEISKLVGHKIVMLDPTAGGGSIPIEALRLGCNVRANDLNPVAAAILKASLEYIQEYGNELIDDYKLLSRRFLELADRRLSSLYNSASQYERIDAYLWARTISCPYCAGVVPLSPNWRLEADGSGIELSPRLSAGPGSPGRICEPVIVKSLHEQSQGTITDGDGRCPFPDCARVIDGTSVKAQAQAGQMGDQLYAVATRVARKVAGRVKWERHFRTPKKHDCDQEAVQSYQDKQNDEWLSLDCIPNEAIDELSNYDRGHRMYGMETWRDFFSARQLASHATASEIYRHMVEQDETSRELTELRKASYVFLSFALDKFRDYNSRQTRWHVQRGVIVNTFDSHNFAMRWSYAEMAPVNASAGLKWVTQSTAESMQGIARLLKGEDELVAGDLLAQASPAVKGEIFVTCNSADNLADIAEGSVDLIVIDPPYYDNVMYAELSDFFYVWLKRTAAHVLPELFKRFLTDKENEAVANPAKFNGQKGAKALAGRDYQERMARIFDECRRVLRPDGLLTLMFTHKATGAWDALTTGLMKAGFSISASWPINTEAESSLHIKDKSAANSTIFLVCRPRIAKADTVIVYWEDVEPLVAKAVRQRVPEFQAGGITGVDLYLASFGPALEEFSKHWPLQRGTPKAEVASRKQRKQAEMFDEAFDPYAVTPEDALQAARREVKTWRLNQLMHMRGKDDLDPVTSWFVLAWDAFKAPVFAYDEALRLARAVGIDLDSLVGRLCEKKGSDLKLWDSATRAAKGALGPADGSRGMIDVIHQVAHLGRTRTLEDARELLTRNRLDTDPSFLNALEAVLEVLPPSKGFLGFDVATGDAKASADDFDALERLRRVAFSEAIDHPRQLELFAKEAAEAGAEVAAA